jgi:hypothetical protein
MERSAIEECAKDIERSARVGKYTRDVLTLEQHKRELHSIVKDLQAEMLRVEKL